MERPCGAVVQVNAFAQVTSQSILESKQGKYSPIKMEDNVDEKAIEYSNENTQTEHQNFNNIAQITEGHTFTCKKEGDVLTIKEEICGKGQNSNEEFDCDNKYFVKMEDFIEMDNQTCLPCGNEEIKIERVQLNFDSFQESFIDCKMAVASSEISMLKTRPKKQHPLTYKDSSDVTTFKCETCSYETKYPKYFKRHLSSHNTFKCETCPFNTKYKYSLKKHLLTHKSLSEVPTFKCEACTYETKNKGSLQQHMLTHKSSSEVTMFKCEMCAYETKRKYNLQQHSATHKSTLEVKMFKCGTCTYETRHKHDLKRHSLKHKSLSEVEMLKCERCEYETRYKCSLRRHLLTHKSLSEVKAFKREKYC